MSCQLSTRCIDSDAIHAAPPKTSLSTTTSRFTRKRRSLVGSIPAMSCTTSSAVPGQSRTKRPDPDHAPYAQPATNTGWAAFPSAPPAGVDTGAPPPTGTRTRAVGVASVTASDAPDGCCSVASAGTSVVDPSPP